eukprot:Gb_10084 [translate_table: standard]
MPIPPLRFTKQLTVPVRLITDLLSCHSFSMFAGSFSLSNGRCHSSSFRTYSFLLSICSSPQTPSLCQNSRPDLCTSRLLRFSVFPSHCLLQFAAPPDLLLSLGSLSVSPYFSFLPPNGPLSALSPLWPDDHGCSSLISILLLQTATHLASWIHRLSSASAFGLLSPSFCVFDGRAPKSPTGPPTSPPLTFLCAKERLTYSHSWHIFSSVVSSLFSNDFDSILAARSFAHSFGPFAALVRPFGECPTLSADYFSLHHLSARSLSPFRSLAKILRLFAARLDRDGIIFCNKDRLSIIGSASDFPIIQGPSPTSGSEKVSKMPLHIRPRFCLGA